MRAILSEYGILVCTIIAGTVVLGIIAYMINRYGDFSKNFIGCMTGTYVSYEDDITLEEIEEGMF